MKVCIGDEIEYYGANGEIIKGIVLNTCQCNYNPYVSNGSLYCVETSNKDRVILKYEKNCKDESEKYKWYAFGVDTKVIHEIILRHNKKYGLISDHPYNHNVWKFSNLGDLHELLIDFTLPVLECFTMKYKDEFEKGFNSKYNKEIEIDDEDI